METNMEHLSITLCSNVTCVEYPENFRGRRIKIDMMDVLNIEDLIDLYESNVFLVDRSLPVYRGSYHNFNIIFKISHKYSKRYKIYDEMVNFYDSLSFIGPTRSRKIISYLLESNLTRFVYDRSRIKHMGILDIENQDTSQILKICEAESVTKTVLYVFLKIKQVLEKGGGMCFFLCR